MKEASCYSHKQKKRKQKKKKEKQRKSRFTEVREKNPNLL